MKVRFSLFFFVLAIVNTLLAFSVPMVTSKLIFIYIYKPATTISAAFWIRIEDKHDISGQTPKGMHDRSVLSLLLDLFFSAFLLLRQAQLSLTKRPK
ncbi:hypothetical protein EDC96DRAFT_284387 [Choanephora cucurbitarum]|nr:hypothetical protein EDC96DRAFT_284387 [Choanephora cucurbitarum]